MIPSISGAGFAARSASGSEQAPGTSGALERELVGVANRGSWASGGPGAFRSSHGDGMPGCYRLGEMENLLLSDEARQAAKTLFDCLFRGSLFAGLSHQERVDLFLGQKSNLQPVDEVIKNYGALAIRLLKERLAESRDISACLTRFATHDAKLLKQYVAVWASAPSYAQSIFQRSMREAASAEANEEWQSEPILAAAWGRMLFAAGQEAWRDYEGADLLAPLLVQLPEWPQCVALQITMPSYAHAHPSLRFTPPEGSASGGRVIELQLDCERDEDGSWRYHFAPVLMVIF